MAGSSRPDSSPRDRLRSDLRAIWLLRSNILLRDIGFWLVLLGYNPKTRRFPSAGYLVYVGVFFSIWGGMVFLLISDLLTRLLTALPAAAPVEMALFLGGLVLLGFVLAELGSVTRRSPLAFSDQDAHLLCPTPIDRRLIVLAWFAEAWVVHTAWLWVFFSTLAAALFELGAPPVLTPAFSLQFGGAGLRALGILLPLSIGLYALVWCVGTWRLKGPDAPRQLGWLRILLFLSIAAGFGLSGWSTYLPRFGPVSSLVASILGSGPTLTGVTAALILAAAGVALLWLISKNISLGLAAQETRAYHALQAAKTLGRTDLINDIVFAGRLGAGRSPAPVPAWSGWRVLLWKNLLELLYLTRLQDILLWSGLTGLNLGMLAYPDWEMRGFFGILWVILLLQIFQPHIQRFFYRWWLNRTLPIKTGWSIASLLLIPVTAGWFAGILTLSIAWTAGWSIPAAVVWGYFASVPGVLLCGTLDVLRRARTVQFLSGLCPGPELLAALSGSLLLFLYGGLAWFLLGHLRLPAAASLSILVVFATAGVSGLFRAASSAMKRIR